MAYFFHEQNILNEDLLDKIDEEIDLDSSQILSFKSYAWTILKKTINVFLKSQNVRERAMQEMSDMVFLLYREKFMTQQ